MFLIFGEELLITLIMAGFFIVSIFIRVLLGVLYQEMIKETDNMAGTQNNPLKRCKIKFSNCYQLNKGVANVPIFVDKFLNTISLGPISFETLYHMSGQAMLLSVVTAGVGICKCIMDGRMLGEILPFYIASFLGLYLYFSISTIVDIRGRRRVLKVNLVDYLENHLSPRMQVTEQDIDMLYGREIYSKGNTLRENSIRRRSQADTEHERGPAGKNVGLTVSAEELEELLQEFLTV